MKIVSKFILNRDDKQFWYVEKAKLSKKSDRTKYFVHASPKNIIEYSDHTFHSIHSIDEKISVAKFTKKATDNLLGELYDENSQLGYNYLINVFKKISNDSNQLNPNLKNVKASLLNGIHIYNNSLLNLDKVDIPYDENYKLINGKESELYIRKKVKNISSLIPAQIEEQEIQKIYVTSVKELVRTKKVA